MERQFYIDQFDDLLAAFKISAQCVDFQDMPNYSYYDIILQGSSKVKDLQKYEHEFALYLKKDNVPQFKPIHSRGIVRIEFIKKRESTLLFKDMFRKHDSSIRRQKSLSCLIGETIDGNPVFMDIAKAPHILIGGTTGSGKSSLLHNIIANLSIGNNSRIFLVDPKNIEFAEYRKVGIHVYNSYKETVNLLQTMILEMERRYSSMRNGESSDMFPYIVIVIDEFSDLSLQDHDDKFKTLLCKLAQKCRAAKIHIILATQRPSAKLVDGNIKANFPTRIACKVTSAIDSRIILDENGAESLMGKGDSIMKDNNSTIRFQVSYISTRDAVVAC